MSRPDEALTLTGRRAIFRAVAEAQDAGLTDAVARQWGGERFAVTAWQVKAIEDEGIHHNWPMKL